MLGLNPALIEFLNDGGTLVVPTRQRAAAVRLAHTAAMLAGQRRLWKTPDVLPWQAWIERVFDAARGGGAPLPRRLRAAEEWLLWRAAVRAACADSEVLLPDDLIDAVRRAVTLMDDWDLKLSPAASTEAAVLLSARHHFGQRCEELGAVGTTPWRRCLEYAAPVGSARLLGFQSLGPARLDWLATQGVTPWISDAAEVSGGVFALAGHVDPEAEIHAAAQWCRAQLQCNPAARLLVVVPQLAQRRHTVGRAFAQTLAPEQIFLPPHEHGESGESSMALGDAPVDPPAPFALEGGQPLANYPIVAAALGLLALAGSELEFAAWSALLRSVYVGLGSEAQRLRLELWLREQNVNGLDLHGVQRLAPRVAGAVDEASGALLRRLAEALATPEHLREMPAFWARRFAAMLAACGWPGTATMRSDEQQLRLRFEALLGEFAALGEGAPRMTLDEASDALQRLAVSIAYEPASDDVPVTITAYLDDPIVSYDGIWVTGLSADVLPAAAAPDALIPLPTQRAAAMPQASAAGQLQGAQQALLDWRRSSRQLVLSWPASDGDLQRDPSPLLQPLQLTAPAAMVGLAEPGAPRDLAHRLQRQGRFETWCDEVGADWPPGRRLPAGTRALELQALCPFRAYAQLRLAARPLDAPAPGIDPRLRGQLLHKALEYFWGATPDSAALCARTLEVQASFVRDCLARASVALRARSAAVIEPLLLRQELTRGEHVIAQLLDWERRREPFSVQAVEGPQLYNIEAWPLGLQPDRVDRLPDGGLAVIDYKTGAVESFDALATRPPRPQLLAYALGVSVGVGARRGGGVAAVAMAYLGREGLTWRGLADRKDRLPGVAALKPEAISWQGLLAQWHSQLVALVREFAGGHAAVKPMPHVCERCHLQMFCRIDSAKVAQAARLKDTEAQQRDGD